METFLKEFVKGFMKKFGNFEESMEDSCNIMKELLESF